MPQNIMHNFWFNEFEAMKLYGQFASMVGCIIPTCQPCPVTGESQNFFMLVLKDSPRFFETEQEALDCATIHDIEAMSLANNSTIGKTTAKGQGEEMHIDGDLIITGSVICGGNVHADVPPAGKKGPSP